MKRRSILWALCILVSANVKALGFDELMALVKRSREAAYSQLIALDDGSLRSLEDTCFLFTTNNEFYVQFDANQLREIDAAHKLLCEIIRIRNGAAEARANAEPPCPPPAAAAA